MAVFGITTIKHFQYRGSTEEWSNHYRFSGTTPADQTAWQTFADALKVMERIALTPANDLIAWYGYNPGSDHANFSGGYSSPTAGTLSTTGSTVLSGDTAVWMRWWTGQVTSKGKKIYLRKYFHPAVCATGTPDVLGAAQTTMLQGLAEGLCDGTLAGGAKICDKDGHVGINPSISPFVTTRTLKRRGKRPG